MERNRRLASSSALFMHTWAATRAGQCVAEMTAMKPPWDTIGLRHVAAMRPVAAEKRVIIGSRRANTEWMCGWLWSF